MCQRLSHHFFVMKGLAAVSSWSIVLAQSVGHVTKFHRQ